MAQADPGMTTLGGAEQGGPMFGRSIDAARAALDTIHREAPWAWADGYQPSGRNPDAGGRRAGGLHGFSADHVAGAKHDVGIGNYAARMAFHVTVRNLELADYLLAHALAIAGIALQYDVMRRPAPILLGTWRQLERTVRWRIDQLDAAGAGTDRTTRKLMALLVEGGPGRREVSAVGLIIDAADELSAAMQSDRGAAGGPTIAMCRYGCGRPAGLKKGGKCDTCAQADYRGNGPAARRDARAEIERLRQLHARHRRAGHGHGYD